VARPKVKRISEISPLFTNLAQSSFYQVRFGGLGRDLKDYLYKRGIDRQFISEDAGLLCNNAVLPTTQLATANITGNYIGMTETIAHTRQYQDISLEFYVDKNYKSLKFLEHWMEFIASGATNPLDRDIRIPGVPRNPISENIDEAYYIRMQYPEYYKSNKTKIFKFERDYDGKSKRNVLEYTFIGLYPYNISSIPVSYSQSNILTMQASFKIDRYVIGRSESYDIYKRDNNNKDPLQGGDLLF
jgi:hypothetical protein